MNTAGRVSKNIVLQASGRSDQSIYRQDSILFSPSLSLSLQWGEMPTSVAYIGTGQIMGWGNKAIEVRTVERNIS